MWILWALISALLAATRRTQEKQLAQKLDHLTLGFMVQLMALPVITAVLVWQRQWINPLSLGAGFWLPLLIVCIGFYPLNTLWALKAIKHGELSKVLPIQSLWPVLSVIPAGLTLHEIPSLLGFTGIILTVLGIYVLGLNGGSLHHPLKPFREDESSRFMLFSVILVTLAGVLDKYAINRSNAVFYSFCSTFGAVLAIYAVLNVSGTRRLNLNKPTFKSLCLIAPLQSGSYTTYLLALSAGPVAYVSAVRSTNVLIGSLLGILVLKEKLTPHKLACFGLILSGGALLAIGS